MGCLFQSTTDTEVINHLIARSNYSTVVDRVIDALGRVKGAYSLLMLTNEALIGVRDPMGVRPLCIGRLEDAWILTSESCGLDIIGARFVRDVEPGEIVIVDGSGLRSIKPFTKQQRRFCVFEHIYFARPDSKIEGVGVYEARKNIGAELAKESPVDADVVVPVPDSGVPAAIGYAKQSGMPFELGIIRNHYVGRTFIEPADNIRHLGVRLKHNANRALIEGKRVILVDDSIVRGTTSMKIVEMVRSAGAARGAHAHRRSAHDRTRASTASTRPSKRQAAGLALRRGWHGEVHRRRFAGLPVDRRPLPRHGPAAAATPRPPLSATPASPATIRSRSTTSSASRTASSRCSPSRSEVDWLGGARNSHVAHLFRRTSAVSVTGVTRSRAMRLQRPDRADHRRLARLGCGGSRGLCQGRRALRAGGAHRGRAGGGRRQDQGSWAARRHAGAARRHRRPGHRSPGRRRSTSASASSTSCWAMPGCLGTLSPIGHIEPAIFERVMAVNVTANWRLIRSLDPLLRQSDAGRAIFITSGIIAARRCPTGAPTPRARPRSTCWSASTPPNAPTPSVRVNLYNPGPTRTGMRKEAFPGENPAVAAATRGACREADPARAAVVHDERRMGRGRPGALGGRPQPRWNGQTAAASCAAGVSVALTGGRVR